MQPESMRPSLALVVPCYNEEAVLGESISTLRGVLVDARKSGLVSAQSVLCLVDDGSHDNTWAIILQHCETCPDVTGIKLARNFGHQSAVLAGMFECDADLVVTIDADLQDDPACIIEMLRAQSEGADVVFGVRGDRTSDSLTKRFTAEGYYNLLRAMGVRIVFNHADFRLMSRKAIDLLRLFPETNLFLRGIIPSIGLSSATVEYSRRMRTAGESKYPLRKMLALAWQGVTSFSVAPLRLVAVGGLVISVAAALTTAWAVYVRLFTGTALPGWASTVAPLYFLGGIQILCIGVIGEYVGKIYIETKRRPRYLVAEMVGNARKGWRLKAGERASGFRVEAE
jgi:glycosyltransferase involved in cell wall biosynthesis